MFVGLTPKRLLVNTRNKDGRFARAGIQKRALNIDNDRKSVGDTEMSEIPTMHSNISDIGGSGTKTATALISDPDYVSLAEAELAAEVPPVQPDNADTELGERTLIIGPDMNTSDVASAQSLGDEPAGIEEAHIPQQDRVIWKTGRRVVELSVLADYLQKCKYCLKGPLGLHDCTNETIQGLGSILRIPCKNCGADNNIPIGKRHHSNRSDLTKPARCWDANSKAAIGKSKKI